MEKKKENEGASYREKLNYNAKQRYAEKLKTINNVDPYNLIAKDWIQDPAALPPLTYPDIVNYRVWTECVHFTGIQNKVKKCKEKTVVCVSWTRK